MHSDEKTCSCVWVSSTLRVAGQPASIFWNTRQLDNEAPFGLGNPTLTQLVKQVAQRSTLDFVSSEVPAVNKEGVYRAEVTGSSANVLMGLATEYLLPAPDTNSSLLRILLTGALDPRAALPAPLRDLRSLNLKSCCARDQYAALLLHEADYDLITPDSGKLGRAGTPIAMLPDSVHAIEAALQNTREGRPFAIPNAILQTLLWRQLLAEILGLRAIAAIQISQVVAHSITAPPRDVLPASHTLGALFAAATPTARVFLSALPEPTRQFLQREFAPESIVAKSLIPDTQRQLFCNRTDRLQFASRHVFIGGPTGTGKTFLAEALMLNTAVELGKPVLYVGPIRELVYQLHSKFTGQYCSDEGLKREDVLLSTGEYGAQDRRLRRGDFKIAFVVNEKANLLLDPNQDLLRKIALVVIDEAHMISDGHRGGVLDMLLAKLLEQNRARAEESEIFSILTPPARIVLISTEDAIADNRVQGLFASADSLPPVIVAVGRRLVAVEHRLVLMSPQPQQIPIVSFASDADRKLSVGRIDQVVDSLPLIPPLDDAARSRSAITLFEEIAKTYKRILVICNSINGSQILGARLTNRIADHQRPRAIPKGFEEKIDSGIVAGSTARRLKRSAAQGIFYHNAEMPRSLRGWIVREFERPAHNDDGAQFVFATETLTYGINLAADCVILLDLQFGRMDPGGAAMRYRNLEGTTFHNMLGRVGRPQYDVHVGAPTPLALICTGKGNHNREEISKMLEMYYAELPLPAGKAVRRSNLLLPKDISRAQDGERSLDRYSYGTFRAVMDGLRHQARTNGDSYTAPQDIVTLMHGTVFATTCSTAEKASISTVVTSLLHAASREPNMELVATGHAGETFAIRPQAEALIDTGTTWKSVRPIREWLLHIENLRGTAENHAVPVELLLPGFIVSIDLWIIARTFCWENDRYLTPQEASENEQLTLGLMRREVDLLAAPVVAAQFCALLPQFVDTQDLDGILDPSRKRAAVYRLATAMFRWLRGAAKDEVDVLSLANPTIANPDQQDLAVFQAKIYERAAWLSVMCLRFFGAAHGTLSPEHVRELFRLSLRLRHGVSADGLPFIQNGSPEAGLSRVEVSNLLNKGVRPSSILRSAEPVAQVSAALPEGDDPLAKVSRAKQIVSDVLSFYRTEVSDLVSAISNDRVRDFIDKLQLVTLLNPNVVDRREQATSRVGEVREALNATLRLSLEKFAHDLPDGRPGHALGVDAFRWWSVIAAPAVHQTDVLVEVWHPWPPADATHLRAVRLTAFGGAVLAVLIARGFVTSTDVRAWAGKLPPRVVRVRELVSELPLTQLPPDLHEVLLSFAEPGLD